RLASVGSGEEHILETVHDLGAAGDRGDGHAVPERLAKGREVCLNAVTLLCPAQCEAKTGDDLVEDQDRARGTRPFGDILEESGHRLVCSTRLEDHGGDLPRSSVKGGFERFDVVELERPDESAYDVRYAGSTRSRSDVP